MPWKVLYFQTNRGNYPVKEFIESVDKTTRAKITDMIFVLSQYGPFIRPPFSKKIIKNIYELRVKSQTSVRILYVFYHNNIYLLNAFKKKTQKTPKKEIKIALDRIKQII